MKISGEDAEEFKRKLNSYLWSFAKPVEDEKGNHLCLNCSRTLDGMLGSFIWGMEWGEGTCRVCGYPARALHRMKDSEGNELFKQAVPIILQYHPDLVG